MTESKRRGSRGRKSEQPASNEPSTDGPDSADDATPAEKPSAASEVAESASRAETDDSAAAAGTGSATGKVPADGDGRRGGGWLGGLALLVALAALALATRPFWSPTDIDDTDDSPAAFSAEEGRALARRVDAAQQALERAETELRAELQRDVRAALDESSGPVESLSAELDAIGAEVQALREASATVDALIERIGRLEGTQSSAEASLEARMAALEQRIEQRVESLQQRLGSIGADLDEAGRASARRMALIHARALLAQGRDRLELDGDADEARAAWARARAATAGVDGLSPDVRAALDRLNAAAASLADVPVTERVRALDLLAAESADWPAPRPTASEGDETVDDPPGEEAGWRDRMASAMGRLVRVESIDDALPNRAEVARARDRIHAALSAAAVASARKDWATSALLIERARRDVGAYLDGEDPAVRQAVERLAELEAAPEPPRLPAAHDEARAAIREALESSR